MKSDANVCGPRSERTGVSIVVPCFNEEAALAHLQDRLKAARVLLECKYVVHLILVNDASTDNTGKRIQEAFANEPNCIFLQHPVNLGIGAAILSGIRSASTEIVCSIDADCSYDPCELPKLISMLSPGIDLVTASPYHPEGRVVDVRGWRIFVSKVASLLYRRVLRQKLHTYTSCFRVYRRSSILQMNLRRRDFLAVAELIGKLDLLGAVIAECPTTLGARVHGDSKMQTSGVLLRHLYLLTELLGLRLWHALFVRPRRFVRAFDLKES